MNWRQSRQEDVARGAIILLISLGIATLIVGARLGSQRLAAPPPTATPVPTATPLPTPTATPLPPTPTPRPAPPTPTPAPVAVAGVDELYARDGRNIVCIDPGHGGGDLGEGRLENGRSGLQEKEFTLENSL